MVSTGSIRIRSSSYSHSTMWISLLRSSTIVNCTISSSSNCGKNSRSNSVIHRYRTAPEGSDILWSIRCRLSQLDRQAIKLHTRIQHLLAQDQTRSFSSHPWLIRIRFLTVVQLLVSIEGNRLVTLHLLPRMDTLVDRKLWDGVAGMC